MPSNCHPTLAFLLLPLTLENPWPHHQPKHETASPQINLNIPNKCRNILALFDLSQSSGNQCPSTVCGLVCLRLQMLGTGVRAIIIIYKMQNNQNPPACKCDPHCFSLRPMHKDRRANLGAVLPMCRSKQLKKKGKKTQCTNYEGPSFNRDRCHATPAFILPSEKTEYLMTTREFLRDHEKKVKEYQEELHDLYIPKPRSKSLYCNVCRESYTEYLEHINLPQHHANIRSCHFNNYIIDLQRQFNSNDKKELSISALTETGSPTTGEDQAEELGIRGRKRVKTSSFTVNNANSSPFTEAVPHFASTGHAQNMFYPHCGFPSFFEMMARMGEYRDFYANCNQMAYNPFISYMPQMSYPGYQYCIPSYPMLPLQIYQQNQ